MRYQLLVWSLLAAILGFAFGGSVSWGIMYSPPQHHAANNHQADQTPAAKQHKDGFWEKTSDDPVAYFTLWLVGFTAVLAVSTIGLWIVTWRASASQARDMQASIAIATRANELTHASSQPLLIIEMPNADDLGWANHEFKANLTFVIRNVGGSAAVVTALYRDWFVCHFPDCPHVIKPQSEHRSGGERWKPTNLAIGPEQASTPILTHSGWLVPKITSQGGLGDRDWVFFAGYIEYKDITGISYVSGFCHAFDPNRTEVGFHFPWPEAGKGGQNYHDKVFADGPTKPRV